MKAIILAGGYATRLHPFTESLPKPLIPIVGKPIIEYIIENIERCRHIDEIIISTNKKFEPHFQNWLNNKNFSKPIKIVVENTTDEKEKLGTIGALNFLIEKEDLDDCLIVGGDNLFDFEISDFIEYYMKVKKPVVAVYDIKDLERAKNFGIVNLDGSKIIEFMEKPSNPKTSLIGTCCYVFPQEIIHLIPKYLEEGNPRDAPGHFVSWLINKEEVHAFIINANWFDIGNVESLKDANEFFAKKYKI